VSTGRVKGKGDGTKLMWADPVGDFAGEQVVRTKSKHRGFV